MRMRVLRENLRVEIENEMRVFLESLNFEIEMRVSQKSVSKSNNSKRANSNWLNHGFSENFLEKLTDSDEIFVWTFFFW